MIKFEKITKAQFKKDCPTGSYDLITLPDRATYSSAGYDIYSPIEIVLRPGKSYLIPTGLKCQFTNDLFLQIFIRSSMAIKHDIVMKNHVGIIDADFHNNINNEGHIFVALKNEGISDYTIKIGDRIAQGIFSMFYITGDDQPRNELRTGGFGSTGK